VNTVAAGPVMKTLWPGPAHSIASVPPRSSTSTRWSTTPRSIEATPTAHAPLPQASVSPVPRSQVRCFTRPRSTSCTNSTFTRFGNAT
jgi:hypothetical protein